MRLVKWFLFVAAATVVFYNLLPEQQRQAPVLTEQQRPTPVPPEPRRASLVIPEQQRPASIPAESRRPAKPAFYCDGRQYCSQMTSCQEAKQFLRNCPGMKMDGNHDGIPCEAQWCG